MVNMDNAHALVVGISNYRFVNPLPEAILVDAQDVRDVLVDPQRCGYPSENIQLLLDGEATRAGLRRAMADLAARSTPQSTVLIYVSSHGGRIDAGPHAGEYLLPVDAVYTSAETLAQTAISGVEFTTALRAIPAQKLVVVFDCCHAGGIGQPKDATAPEVKALPESYYDGLTRGRGRVILASSRSSEVSWVLPGARNSLFTHHLLDGLRGGAPGPGGVIRIFDLFDYLQPRVTADRPNQHPIFKAEIEENLALALYLGGKAAPPAPPVPPADEYVYDAFISYHDRGEDRTWARKTLAPRLEAAGLRVSIDYRDFHLGAPKVQEIARAVEQSRYTIAVLSPAYLESDWDGYENILAESLGLERGQYRLLAVIREPCEPRLGIRIRPLLDMSDSDEFEAALARLVYQLRMPPDK